MQLNFEATMLPRKHDKHSLVLEMSDDIQNIIEQFTQWYIDIGEMKGAPKLVSVTDDDGDERDEDDATVMLSRAYTPPRELTQFLWMLRGLNWVEYDADDSEAARAIYYVGNISDAFVGDEDDLSDYEATDDLSIWVDESVEDEFQSLKDDCDGRIEDYVDWDSVLENLVSSTDEADCYSGKYVIDGNTYFVRQC